MGEGDPVETKITVEKAAALLGYHPDHVRRLLRAGVIQGEKVCGVVWLIDRSEVEYILSAQRNGRFYRRHACR